MLESKDKNLKVLECKDKELKMQGSKVSINSKQDKLKNQSSEYHMMWVVFFYMFSFMVTFLLKIEILEIYGEDLRKIPTGHELNQVVKCEGSLNRGKDEK